MKTKPQRPFRFSVVVTDDDVVDAECIKKYAEKSGCHCDVITDHKLIYQAFDENYYDVAFCDVQMPGFDLEMFLKYCMNRFPDIPFIIMNDISVQSLVDHFGVFPNVLEFVVKPVGYDAFNGLIDRVRLINKDKIREGIEAWHTQKS